LYEIGEIGIFFVYLTFKRTIMEWNTIKTNVEYITALKRVILIMDARPDSPEAKERELLLSLLKKYEQKHVILPELDLMPS
jgi:HTH-type transcriptional regulator/antitoxin HigA